MKENKNWVFALKALPKNEEDGKDPVGYIVFPDDKEAFQFLSFSEKLQEHPNHKEQNTKYEALNWVFVEDAIAKRVEGNGMLFLDSVKELEGEALQEAIFYSKNEFA